MDIKMFTFEYDSEKAKKNLIKHKVNFDEYCSAFYDPNLKDFFDDLHSDEEDRFLLVGRSNHDRVILISYTVRDEIIRIISARPLRKNEVKKYGYEQ
jgi:uncharacterized DUF497 family protein